MNLRSVVCSLFVVAIILFIGGCSADRPLVGMQILPSAQTLNAVGETVQLNATGIFQRPPHPPATRDITNECTWNSSNKAVATVSSSGLVTAVGAGTATITASYETNTVTANALVTVNTTGAAMPRDLISLAVMPTAQTVNAVGQTAQYLALGNFSKNPTTEDLTAQATWSSSAPQVATVSNTGLATAVGQGTTTITAKVVSSSGSTIIGTASFTQTSAVPPPRDLISISIVPSSQSLETTGETAQFLAVGTFSSAPITAFLNSLGTADSPAVTWKSSATQVATIDSSGLATAKGKGTSTITANATAVNNQAAIVGIASLEDRGGPTPTVPLLTIVKLGSGAANGVVTSNPSPINCGPSCNASFPLGSTVTLTASPASSFRGWSSNCTPMDSVACTVTIEINTVVGAIFD